MSSALRFFLAVVLGAAVLAAAPAALGDGSTDQVVIPYRSGNCFLVETLDGTLKGCTPFPAGVVAQNFGYAAAADGSIVFTADDSNRDPTSPGPGNAGSLWLVRPSGPYTLGAAAHLDTSTWDYDATISYNGSKVVFVRYDPTTGSSDIYSVNSDGSGLRLVLSGGGATEMTLPSISPDGSVIAYWCRPSRVGPAPGCPIGASYRNSGLMRVNSDGSNPRMILIGPGDAIDASGPTGLSWSPDGQWLTLDGLVNVDLGNGTYTTQRQAFRYRSDGSALFNNRDPTRQITHETGQQAARQAGFSPQFSPDGSGILYEEIYDDQGNAGDFTYAINVDGTNRHQVPISNYGEFIPTATPGVPPPWVDATQITVPSVVNLDLAGATSTLEAANLTVGTVSQAYSETVPANLVMSQDPSAGTLVHRTDAQGPPVNLVISEGPAPCVVPKVAGKSLQAAKQALAAAHCDAGRVKRSYSRTVKKGRVISEKPGAGTTLGGGAKVALTVSKGKKPRR